MRVTTLVLSTGLLVATCGGAAPDEAEPSATTQPTATTSSTAPTSTSTATTTSPASTTTTTSASQREATIAVTGPEEVVYDWTTDRCEDLDIPDLPARAFRDAEGIVHLISPHTTARDFTGPSLDLVTRNCTPLFRSTNDPDPAAWADYEWIASTWTSDGTTVYALVHNEYHGWERGDCTGTDPFGCWYNAITAVVSTDGGQSYGHVADPPGHLVAALPQRYVPETAAVGLFSPSNIVRGPDDHWYVLAKVGAHGSGAQSVCLMRTADLSDPTAWRFWDGAEFAGIFIDPYREEPGDPSAHECPALAIDEIGAQMIESLTWNTLLERWVAVGISADHLDGREVWGFYYSFSDDLVNWTRRELLMEVPLPWTVEFPGDDLSYLYPSVLDPDSASPSFETADGSAYLYYTRNNFGHGSLDRDLVRVPIEFSFVE